MQVTNKIFPFETLSVAQINVIITAHQYYFVKAAGIGLRVTNTL